jgi:outer membrane immunogenic protein
MRGLVVGLGLFGLLGASADAADLMLRSAPVAPAPAFSWSGCYLGGHAGAAWSRTDATADISPVFILPGTAYHSSSPGAVGGGQVGCNYQVASNWVLGVEGEFSATAFKQTDFENVTATISGFQVSDIGPFNTRTDWIAATTGRLGYAADRWLVYAKGGPAWIHNKYDYSGQQFSCAGGLCGEPFPLTASASETRLGWTVGAGAEWAFWDRWSAKVEYDFYDFGSHSVTFNSVRGINSVIPVPLIAPTTFTVAQQVHVAKLGVNYRLWAP